MELEINAIKQRWLKFSQQARIPDSENVWDTISSMHAEKSRFYHNLEHVHDCLSKLDQWKESQHNVEQVDFKAIELALWFHDMIYDTHRSDNEEASAELLADKLDGHDLTDSAHKLILATQHSIPLTCLAEKIICDIDLSILGAESADKYCRYAHHIRQEYHWVNVADYCKGRIQVLNSFLDRSLIYQTEYAISRWEKNARINLIKEKSELEKGIIGSF